VGIFRKIPFRLRLVEIIKVLSKKLDSYLITLTIPRKYFLEFREIEFYGEKFKIPNRAEEYLAYKYGKDWKTPQKYVYWEDDGSISKKCRYR
jgi:hypothetical protein